MNLKQSVVQLVSVHLECFYLTAMGRTYVYAYFNKLKAWYIKYYYSRNVAPMYDKIILLSNS